MNFEKFQEAVDILEIASKITQSELKKKYQKLSKIYHPDMPDGDAVKFKEINEAYKLVSIYIQNFRFKLDEEEFYEQNPLSRKSKDWFYSF
ncbi:Heat shock protein DnaJ-like protein [Sulfurimonas denitrificans DSM 1251]|uniref:Heat shock protein DnaJ-like protein n=1 Tax=Sulfurimonas denitrificans (strain ATCC 33889 / DSM 1251) TaxID=326298 RepID=Q30R73_SULDN|nr:DnaJ domain-containing protein [Sulfurimonas denitrificans]ABB44508.1 Heat shock protein DnaJ-like protein [Sulfurimonas denitrificans DSM 1251]MDD3441690.1 DnaJ domain-containing protein [Sulfurimonas denitrificans]